MTSFELISDLHAEALQGGGFRKPYIQKPSCGKPPKPEACCNTSTSSTSTSIKMASVNTFQDNVVNTFGAGFGLNAASVRDQLNSATISVTQ